MIERSILVRLAGLLLLLAILATGALPASAATPANAGAMLELPLVFSDGVVLQRDRPLPVWGRAAPGAKVEVEFDGRKSQVQAGADGRWMLQLPAHAAGGPFELVVRAGNERRRIGDVLVGEVWLASGQSNMEWPLAQTLHGSEDVAAAGDPQLRHFKVPKSWAEAPRSQLEGGQWKAASPRDAGEFSAIGYHFARQLRDTLKVPVGIIDSTWGGSSIEAWMSASMLGLDAAALEARMAQRRAQDAVVEEQVRRKVAAWPAVDPASDAYAAAGLEDHGWASIKVPSSWEAQGYAGMDGTAWYRTTFELSAREAAAGITLGLGQIDDTDSAWVNGTRVGGVANGWNVPRVYAVPPSALRAGLNTLAVRVEDAGGGGGIIGSLDQLYLQPAGGARRSLAGQWRFRTAQVRVSLQDDKNQIETLLYNAMVHPLQPYSLAGVIWYQGEANASDAGAYVYRDQFRGLIQGWRAGLDSPQLPFLWVQLAPFHTGDRLASDGSVIDSSWATLRESQSAALALPATGQAVITDAGDTHDIHPRDKRTPADRLARIARHLAYGDAAIAWTGPVFRAAQASGGRMVVQFDHADGALAARGGGPLQGFELAGSDGRFHPAQAQIEGDSVVLRSAKVKQPAIVRYGWKDDPHAANLVGRDGLPASPFRSREW